MVVAASSVRMDQDALARIEHLFQQQIEENLHPGAALGDERMGCSDEDGVATFGHGGAGTSVGWADPESGLDVAYITNGFQANETNNPRLAAVSRAVRDACR